MFDQLIESNSPGAENKKRGRFFTIATMAVGVLFASAVLFSIYAADIDIGNSDFELARLLAPVVANSPEPDPPAARSPQNKNFVTETSQRPVRRAAVQRIDQPPAKIQPVSNTPSQLKELPVGSYDIGKVDLHPPASGPVGKVDTAGKGSGLGTADDSAGKGREVAKTTPPPDIEPPVRKNVVVSLGVVNGKATSLPQPVYPQTAIAVNATGVVNVQITIDVDGKVISSKAVSGHPLLKKAAEDAARRARFSPTLLSNHPVKATGLIAYNFRRS
jgi:TonB family protein